MRLEAPLLCAALCFSFACDSKEASGDAEAKSAKAKAKAKAEAEKGSKAEDKAEAVDAFTEYQRKSMRSEALVNTRMIADGLRAAVVSGDKPVAIPVSPAPGSCCKQPKGQCPADDGAWDDEAWKALNFTPRGPHRYSYQVDVKGDQVTVTATADLDCDGTLSTFALEGKVSEEDIDFNTDEPVETNPLD